MISVITSADNTTYNAGYSNEENVYITCERIADKPESICRLSCKRIKGEISVDITAGVQNHLRKNCEQGLRMTFKLMRIYIQDNSANIILKINMNSIMGSWTEKLCGLIRGRATAG